MVQATGNTEETVKELNPEDIATNYYVNLLSFLNEESEKLSKNSLTRIIKNLMADPFYDTINLVQPEEKAFYNSLKFLMDCKNMIWMQTLDENPKLKDQFKESFIKIESERKLTDV